MKDAPTHIKDLVPDRRNARKHNPRNIGLLERSLQEVGGARSIVIDEDNNILAGNGTIEAAGNVDITRLRVIDATGDEIIAVRRSGLTEEQKKRLALLDNRTAELAGWDAEELARMQIEGFDFDGLFTQDELDGIVDGATGDGDGATEEAPEAEVDRADELREKWGTEAGQLWQIGRHRLFCGDSANAEDVARLMDGRGAAACVCDPPYGIDHDTDYTRFTGGAIPSGTFAPVHGDAEPFDPAHLLRYPYTILWGANCFSNQLPRGSWLIWDKRQEGLDEGFLSDGEAAWFNRGHGVYIHAHVWSGFIRESERGATLHPTQKPVALMEWCLERIPAGSLVFDPYNGSGPVMAACERKGYTCYAAEIDPRYVAVTLERMSAMGLEPALVA